MRNLIKKIIYKLAGQKGYEKAYVRGKIADINHQKLDEPELQFLSQFIYSDSTVLDLGANYGHYTVEMGKLCTKGRVYAFEPIPFTFRVLKRVVDHFKLSHVQLFEAAVSHQIGEVDMVLPLLDFGGPDTGVAYIGQSTARKSEKVLIKTVVLDEQQLEGRVDFIKMDIEGHEPKAMKGMEGLMTKNRPVILIEFSHNCLKRATETPSEFANYIVNQLDYRFYQAREQKLVLVDEKVPADGYYFLIPQEKMNALT
jgi:FkbM family methyltransferase